MMSHQIEPDEIVRRLFLPDGSAYGLSSAYAARSGSGKTHHLTYMVNRAIKMKDFENTRFLYLSIKQEDYFGVEPTSSISDLFKRLGKEQLVVYYPSNPENYEGEVDYIIEEVFDMSDANEDAQFVILIDDVNVLDGFTSRGFVSPSVKKLVIAGRSKGITGCFLCHRLGNLPRIMNGNLSSLIVLSINPMDNAYAKRVFGIDFDIETSHLNNYRWVYADLIEDKTYRYSPVPESI